MTHKDKKWGLWPLAIGLFLTGCFVRWCVPGCSFSALILWALSALTVLYQLLRIYAKKEPKTGGLLRRILTVCVCIGLAVVFITGCFVFPATFGHPEVDCDYIVVLGAGVNGSIPSLSLRERINAAYDYLTAHPSSIAVVSGGQGPGEDITEAQSMYDELVKMGIDPQRVWMEDQATSTWENLGLSLALIEARTGSRPAKIGLVSSEYHMFRAGLFARDHGVEAVGIPATTSWLHLRVNYFFREIAGVWHYIIFGG